MSSQNQRSPVLDSLRAVAVILVLGRHMAPPQWGPASGPFSLAGAAAATWYRGGWIGVDLFFVLSGFLVSGLLFKEHIRSGRISAGRFLIRRGLKIYPGFWVLLAVTCVLASKEHVFTLPAFFSELLFVQNYGPSFWNHTWSLAVEEHFYLLLVLFLLLLSRRGRGSFTAVPVVFAAVAVVALSLRLWLGSNHPFSYKTHLDPSHLRLDSLLFGVLLSYFYHYHGARFRELSSALRVPALAVGTLALVPAFIFPVETTPWMSSWGLTMLYLGSGLLLFGTVTLPAGASLLTRAVAYVGSRSYSIYLWHSPVRAWLIPFAQRRLTSHWSWSLDFTIYMVASIGLGIAMAALIELPVLSLRDRWFPSVAGGAVLETPSGIARGAERAAAG